MPAPLSDDAAFRLLERRALAGPFLPGYVSGSGDRRIAGAGQALGDVVVVDLDWRRVVLDGQIVGDGIPQTRDILRADLDADRIGVDQQIATHLRSADLVIGSRGHVLHRQVSGDLGALAY